MSAVKVDSSAESLWVCVPMEVGSRWHAHLHHDTVDQLAPLPTAGLEYRSKKTVGKKLSEMLYLLYCKRDYSQVQAL